jgi:hypothetical protein
MTATVTLMTPATPANEDGYSFFDVELTEYDSDTAIRAHVKVCTE